MNSKLPASPFVSIGQIAEMMYLGRATVKRWVDYGGLKCHTLPTSNHHRVHIDDLIEFLKTANTPVTKPLQKLYDEVNERDNN